MTDEQTTAVRMPVLGDLTYREIHAVVDGLYCGVHGIRDSTYDRERHYWRAGWLIGDWYGQRRR